MTFVWRNVTVEESEHEEELTRLWSVSEIDLKDWLMVLRSVEDVAADDGRSTL